MALGDAEMKENFKQSAQTQLVLLIFLMAISFTQVVMLNMLIAVMSNTFDNAMDLQVVNTIRSRLLILGDFAPLLNLTSKTDEENVYMVVIRQVTEETDEDSW